MHKEVNIRVDRAHVVHGQLEGARGKPLVIIVHGLPGNFCEGLYEQAARWFVHHGFAAYRFNLYDWQKDARQLMNCTLRTHADDLDAVVRYFRKRHVKKIYVIGHSFGGPTILLSKRQDFDAAVLWDPSFDISFTKERYGLPGGTFVKSLDGYLMRWGANVVIGKAMAREVDRLPWMDLPKRFHAPLKIIAAGNGILVPGARRYLKSAHAPKELTIVKGATHYFSDTDAMRDHLFTLSKRWIGRF